MGGRRSAGILRDLDAEPAGRRSRRPASVTTSRLSIVGAERSPDSGYLRAKVAQEKLIEKSSIPYSIVHATQFFEFVAGIADGATEDGKVHMAPVLFQPIAADDVAQAVCRVAVGAPLNGRVEVAGPEQYRMDEFFRAALAALNDPREVVTDEHARYFGTELSERSLVPLGDAILGETKYADWHGRSTGLPGRQFGHLIGRSPCMKVSSSTNSRVRSRSSWELLGRATRRTFPANRRPSGSSIPATSSARKSGCATFMARSRRLRVSRRSEPGGVAQRAARGLTESRLYRRPEDARMSRARSSVLFIHGLWLHPSSWAPWLQLRRRRGPRHRGGRRLRHPGHRPDAAPDQS